MIYVSMIEIFFKAQEALVAQMGHRIGSWITVAAFFGGMLVIAIIDKLIPPGENPHEIRKIEDVQTKDPQPKRLMRMGIFTVLAIAIHNSIIVAYLDMISISTAPRVDGISNGNCAICRCQNWCTTRRSNIGSAMICNFSSKGVLTVSKP